MEPITVYQKPSCSKCSELNRILKEKRIPFEAIDYYIIPISKEKLTELIQKMGMKAAELLRTKEVLYKEFEIKKKDYSEKELIALMVENPDLMQRPIVERGERAILARPVSEIEKILN